MTRAKSFQQRAEPPMITDTVLTKDITKAETSRRVFKVVMVFLMKTQAIHTLFCEHVKAVD